MLPGLKGQRGLTLRFRPIAGAPAERCVRLRKLAMAYSGK